MLILSEDQKLLMASARGAVAEKAPIAEFRNLRADRNGLGFSPAFWRASAELGWTGVLVPEAFGGLDFGVVGAGLIAREGARACALALPVNVGSVGKRACPGGVARAERGLAAADRARRSDRRLRARRGVAPRRDRDHGDAHGRRLAARRRQAVCARRPCRRRDVDCRQGRGRGGAVSRHSRRGRPFPRRPHPRGWTAGRDDHSRRRPSRRGRAA